MKKLGKYEILEKVGEGGFGVVYKARDIILDRFVALKVLHPQLTIDLKFIDHFKREARDMARIDHGNVITIHEIAEEDGQVFIAMTFLDSGSLRDRLEQGPLTLEEALIILTQLGAGLQAGHNEGLIHRDIKPENILFDKYGQVVIADFGLAKAISLSTSSVASSFGAGAGTPHYRAPELWQGTPPPSPATDVYSLACVFVEMLTAKKLFDGPTPPVVMKRHFDPVDWVDGIAADVPEELRPCLKKALEENPEDRYQSVKDFVEAIWATNLVQPVLVKPYISTYPGENPPTFQKPKKWFSGLNKKSWIVAGGIGLALIMVMVGVWLFTGPLKGVFSLADRPTATRTPTVVTYTATTAFTETETEAAVSAVLASPSSSPTDRPIPEREVIESNLLAFVDGKNIYLRAGPDIYHPAVSSILKDGTEVDLLSSDPTEQWFYVKMADGQEGWLYQDWVLIEGDTGSIPVENAVPTPPNTPMPTQPPTATFSPPTQPPSAPTATPTEEPYP